MFVSDAEVQLLSAERQLRSRQTVVLLSQTMWKKCKHLAEKIDKDSLQNLLGHLKGRHLVQVFENPRQSTGLYSFMCLKVRIDQE